MKSEHRHELKSNELVDWLSNLPEWLKNNLGSIIVIIVAICTFAVFFAWKHYSRSVKSGEQEQFTNMVDNVSGAKARIVSQQMSGQSRGESYILLDLARELDKFAQGTGNENIAALALIKGAESTRSDLNYRPESVSKQDITDDINKAKSIYTQALEKVPSNRTIKALATFGLGMCDEQLGNFAEARKVYKGIVENEDFKGTIAVNKAKLRLATMDDYMQEIVFKPSPPMPMPDINSTLQSVRNLISPEPNQPAESNAPSDINNPAAIIPGQEGTDINKPAGIILEYDANNPFNSVQPSEANMPLEVNPNVEINLPADSNVQE